MGKILRNAWIFICSVIVVVFVVSCLTAYIPPSTFSYISLLAIAFPYLLLLAVFCCITLFFIKRKLAIIFFIVVLLAGFKNISNTIAFNPKRWSNAKSSNTLRVMTWNVEYFISFFPQSFSSSYERVKMLDTIRYYSPDVLCIQEYRDYEKHSFFVSVKKELDSLGYKYSFVSNDSILPAPGELQIIGVAVFSRTPFTDSGRINIINKTVNENLIYTDVNFNNHPVRVFTAHLRSFALYPDTANGVAGTNIYQITYKLKHSIEYRIRETELMHENEVSIIRQAINSSPYPVIYCGDINSTPASYTYNKLKGNLQDAFLQKGSGIGVTFYHLLYTLRIDVCLLDEKLKATQCTVLKADLSDHFPVVTDVVWK